MSALDSQSLIEGLPTELLERIFLFTSARDILRLSSVNHAFYGLIRASPSIRYEITLFGAGLQSNPRTETSLVARRAAFEAYRRRWRILDPAEKWDNVLDVSGIREAIAVGGTYGILWRDSVKFFTLGSVSRGIPRREWGISLKHVEASFFTFYPQANIMAVVEEVAWTWIVYLSTLSDGQPHPTARIKTLSYTFAPGDGGPVDILDISITGSRLVILRGVSSGHVAQVVVWDWTTGQFLLELKDKLYRSAKFVDDYWLALTVASCGPAAPPRLVLLNTEQASITLARTAFHFNPHEHLDVDTIYLHLDQGGYKPSPEEALLAPFYQDASQRVLAIEIPTYEFVLVARVEVLLKLARERGGGDLEWGQWNARGVEVQPRGSIVREDGSSIALWISGARVFWIYWSGDADGETWMYERDLSRREFPKLNVVQRLPWDGSTIQFPTGAHDSITFLMDSEDGENPLAGTMHVWNF